MHVRLRVHVAELLSTLIRINEPVNIHELQKSELSKMLSRTHLSTAFDGRTEAIAY